MVYLPIGSSDLIMILFDMTSNLLVLVSFSTLYSSSLWRTDSIVFSKLNKLLPLKRTTAPRMVGGVGGGGAL